MQLPEQARQAVLQKEMAAVMLVPDVPVAVAAAFLRSGSRFDWQQLLTAARSAVPGLEVWVCVHRELQLTWHHDVPGIAVAMCCGDEVNMEVRSSRLPAEQLAGLGADITCSGCHPHGLAGPTCRCTCVVSSS
jgi:hypothetical protein